MSDEFVSRLRGCQVDIGKPDRTPGHDNEESDTSSWQAVHALSTYTLFEEATATYGFALAQKPGYASGRDRQPQ